MEVFGLCDEFRGYSVRMIGLRLVEGIEGDNKRIYKILLHRSIYT